MIKLDTIDISCRGNKSYSPIGVRNLIIQAEKENNGNFEAVLNNKHKYKYLIELYHGHFLALALYKQFGADYKFNICSSEIDPPDLFFLQKNKKAAFPVEIMELYKHNEEFKDYKKLVKHIWDKKGLMNYKTCYLLLASRLIVDKFNVIKFVQELKNYNWKFQRIYISFYTNNDNIQQWTFFEIPTSPVLYNNSSPMHFNLNEDKKYLY